MNTLFSRWRARKIQHLILCAVILLLWVAVPAVGQQESKPSSTKKSGSATAPASKQSKTKSTSEVPNHVDGVPVRQTALSPVDPGYVIGPQDVLSIDVLQSKELSGNASVRPDGKITLPLVNDIQAAGLTPTELAAAIMKVLSKYVNNPQVTVKVEQINSKMVYILGEVYKPGGLPLLRKLTVLQALALAGGPTQFANSKKIYVLRMENDKQVRYAFNYKEAVKGKDLRQNIVLQPGDTIVVH